MTEHTPARGCIYCGAELTDETELAHVMQEALGGRLRTNKTVCTSCNHGTQPFEDRLHRTFHPIAAVMGAVKGNNSLTSPARIPFGEGGVAEVRAGVVNTVRSDPASQLVGDEVVTTYLGSDTKRMVSEYVNRMFREGITPDDVSSGRVRVEIDRPARPPVTRVELTHSVDESSPALVKMAVELIAYHSRALAMAEALTDARAFARHGKPVFEGIVLEPDLMIRGPLAETPEPRFANAVEVWTATRESVPRLVARVTLYGFVTFTFLLSDRWDAQTFATYYVVDPLDPTVRVESSLELGLDVPWDSRWEHRRNASPAELATRNAEFSSLLNEHVAKIVPAAAPKAALPTTQEILRLVVTEYRRRWLAKKDRSTKGKRTAAKGRKR